MKNNHFGGINQGSGSVAMRRNTGTGILLPTFRELVATGFPEKGVSQEVNAWRMSNLLNLWRGVSRAALSRTLGISHTEGTLFLSKIAPMGLSESRLKSLLQEYAEQYVPGVSFPYWASTEKGVRFAHTFYGLASLRVVTTAGVGFIVDAFQNIVELEIMKYHGLGTGNTAEAVGDTALQTELTTQYNPDNTRATGSLTEGAGANVFRTIGTNTVDASASVVEHGLLSQAATGGGVLLDRSVFSVISLVSGDSIQSTYDHTQVAGS